MRPLLSTLLLLPCLALASPAADLVVVHKSSYSLALMKDGKVLKRFWIALGAAPHGDKLREGDQRTPEGRYLLDYKLADSAFHRAIHISYPNAEDLAQARARGLNPGGRIMIHGQRNGFDPRMQPSNWTNGCIALLNHDMDELWNAVAPGTPIVIYP
ncbi:L,D-transpeptidase family protein [Gallaecimonas kandeliae]|uniref:L,D-transpeptidase family protein n=1 Tax=Gallaecimonas kandeliae TaxID=3029055 RepID=UPI002647E5DC|nr:L,D-transpeptidase family protein [Gallaecimonas kandeliae]WKE65105.1 L,D-transpeptidase family protein [Gallaecimonas kandeliae]